MKDKMEIKPNITLVILYIWRQYFSYILHSYFSFFFLFISRAAVPLAARTGKAVNQPNEANPEKLKLITHRNPVTIT